MYYSFYFSQGNYILDMTMQSAGHFPQGEDDSLGFSPSSKDWVNIYKLLNPLQWCQKFSSYLNSLLFY